MERSPPATGFYPANLRSALSTDELIRRPSRPPDHDSENHALIVLMNELATKPQRILQRLADSALALCSAQSAGISLLDEGQKRFYWPAIAGVWASHVGGGTPREFGPCGTVLDRNVPLIFSHPELDFPYFADVMPCVEEALLVPFYVSGKAVGTIWVVAHDKSKRFDSEDLRVMNSLSMFAANAYQTLLSLNSAQHIASMVDSSNDAIVSKRLDGTITSWNAAAQRLFGYTPDEIIGQNIMILIPSDRQDEERMIIECIGRDERIERYETIRRRKDGSLVPISLTISPIKNSDGEIVGVSKIAHDISDRRRKEEHIALLSREVNHRAKNLLALVQATVHLAKGDTAAELKASIEGRIQALANVHGQLTLSQGAGADIRSLISEELLPFRQAEARVALVGPSLIVKPKPAQTLAMVVHELTTNAVKYGALSISSGRLGVEWSHANGKLILVWTETNGPTVDPPSRRGFGTMAIEQLLSGELNGDVNFDWKREGLVCKLTLESATEI
jgi:PAS domain S-box-containing protein